MGAVSGELERITEQADRSATFELIRRNEMDTLLVLAIHLRLLDACRDSGLPASAASALRDVDNLHIALTLAQLDDRP